MSEADADTALPQLREPPPLWKNVSFHLLWVSTFASGVGDRLIMVAAWAMLGLGRSDVDNASVQAGVEFWFFLPYVLWSPFAGWLVDRLPRKWVMFFADELRGLIVLAAFLYMAEGVAYVPLDHQWKVHLTICFVGIMAATFVPAKLSIIPNVVGNANLQRANSMVVSMGVIGNLLGFLVALLIGLAVGATVDGLDSIEQTNRDGFKLRTMLIVSSVFYMGSGIFWAFLKTPFKHEPTVRGELDASGASPFAIVRQIWEGMRYSWQHRPMRVLIATAGLVWGGTSIYQPALASLNMQHFGGDDGTFQLLLFAVGLGMLLGSVIMGVLNPRRGGELLMVAGLVGIGCTIGLQMIVPWYIPALILALLTGTFATVLLIPLYSLLQRITADHIRGRVFAAKELLTEIPKVALSAIIYFAPAADAWSRWAGGALAIALLASAAWGFRRYVLTGPIYSKYLNFMWRVGRLLCDAIHHVKVIDKHRFPSSGGFLIVSNHTGGADPMFMQCSIQRLVHWMMAKEYMIGLLKRFWNRFQPIAVERAGRDSGPVRDVVRYLRAGEPVGIFPEGRINDDPNEMRKFQPGIGMIANKADVPIVPVFLSGTPSGGSPFVAYIKPSRTVVRVGEPFRLDPGLDRKEATAEIRRRIEALRPPSDPDAPPPVDPPAADAEPAPS